MVKPHLSQLLKILIFFKLYIFIPIMLIYRIICKPLFIYYTHAQGIKNHTISYATTYLLFFIIIPCIFAILYLYIFRIQLYCKLTGGRNYKNDSIHNYGFFKLVNFYNNSEPHKLDSTSYKVQSWREGEGICFGYDNEGRLIYLPKNCEYNFAIFGPPGSSKTAGFCNVNALTFPGSCLIVDIKSDIYNYVKKHQPERKTVRFCPTDKKALKNSAHFDPFYKFKTMSVSERKIAVSRIADILIPMANEKEENSYFPKTARLYFCGITHLLFKKNKNITFPQVIHKILVGNFSMWVKMAIEGDCLEAKELLAPLYGNNEKNVSGAYQHLTEKLQIFSNPILDKLLKPSPKKTITPQLLDNGYDIYLQIDEKSLKTPLGSLLTMVIELISDSFLEREDTSTGAINQNVLIMLDELSSLKLPYELLNSNLSKLRSKSVLTAIILQNLPQLQALYGTNGAESILGNCHVQSILGANDNTTAEYFSKRLGTKSELFTSINSDTPTHKNKTTTVHEVAVFKPEDISAVGIKQQNLLYMNGQYALLQKLNSYKEPFKVDGIQNT